MQNNGRVSLSRHARILGNNRRPTQLKRATMPNAHARSHGTRLSNGTLINIAQQRVRKPQRAFLVLARIKKIRL